MKNTDLKNRVLRNLKESSAEVVVCDLSFFFVFFVLKLNFFLLLLFHPRFVSSHNSGFKVGGGKAATTLNHGGDFQVF